jgi:hypothetical protein
MENQKKLIMLLQYLNELSSFFIDNCGLRCFGLAQHKYIASRRSAGFYFARRVVAFSRRYRNERLKRFNP